MLNLSESGSNCSRSTKYVAVLKLVKDFHNKPLEKTVTPKSFAYHHMRTLLAKFFNTPVPLSGGVKSIFSLGIKTFFVQKG